MQGGAATSEAISPLRRARLILVSLACAATGLLGLPAAASATFPGTPGQLAWIDTSWNLEVGYLGKTPHKVAGPLWNTAWSPAKPGCHLYPTGGHLSAPSWSPDGTRIAYVDFRRDPGVPPCGGVQTAIHVVGQDGSGGGLLTDPPPCSCRSTGPVDDYSPTWSPDGKRIAFVRFWPGLHGINVWTANATGGNEQQLTHLGLGSPVESVQWSPAGGQLAAMVIGSQGYELDLVDAQSGIVSRLKLLTSGAAVTDWDWAPDGKSIVLDDGAHQDEYLLNVSDHTTQDLGWGTPGGLVRFSPDDSGVIRPDCYNFEVGNGGKCGQLVEHTIPDPKADIRPTEQKNRPTLGFGAQPADLYTGKNIYGPPLWSSEKRLSLFDVQAQQIPIFFLPGFAGSKIVCSDSNWPSLDWPPSAFRVGNGDRLRAMDLRSDGRTNAACASAGPTPDRQIASNVDNLPDVGPGDIYGKVGKWLQGLNPKGGVTLFGWDWRRDPTQTVDALDSWINLKLHQGLPKREGARSVMLFGHSYGGLLIRTYLQQHPEKVSRVLTVGTPYWGSPKAIFPIAFGVETPLGSPLNFLLPSDAVKEFFANLAGDYQLFPDDNYVRHQGPWLSLSGQPQSQSQVGSFLDKLGGNEALYNKALGYHRDIYDGFYDNNGLIDVRAAVGLGLPTVGAVNFQRTDAGDVFPTIVNGDGTVPALSQIQGKDMDAPLLTPDTSSGDQVHVQAICGAVHMTEPGDPQVENNYRDFILQGTIPRKTGVTPESCPPRGEAIEMENVRFEDPSVLANNGSAQARAATTGPATMSLSDAAFNRNIQLIPTAENQQIAITDGRDPVNLTFSGKNVSFSVAPVGSSSRSLAYGPASGDFVFKPGTDGKPTVTVDGKALKPHPFVKVRSRRAAVKKRRVRIKVSCLAVASPCAGKVLLKPARGHGTYGKAKLNAEPQASTRIKMRLSHKASRALKRKPSIKARVKVSLSSPDGASAVSVRLKLRG